MRIVLDTNVLVSGFFFGGVPGQILTAWRDRRIRIVFSPSIFLEYRETGALLESRYGGEDFEAFAALILLHSDVVDASEHLPEPVCEDPDDDKFLSCAAAGGVRTVISGDTVLLNVSGWRGIEVVKPRSFVEQHLRV